MAKMIQVRNVPDDVHRILKIRAAAVGLSLSDYIKQDLVEAATRPTLQELDARVTRRGRSKLSTDTVLSALNETRDGQN